VSYKSYYGSKHGSSRIANGRALSTSNSYHGPCFLVAGALAAAGCYSCLLLLLLLLLRYRTCAISLIVSNFHRAVTGAHSSLETARCPSVYHAKKNSGFDLPEKAIDFAIFNVSDKNCCGR